MSWWTGNSLPLADSRSCSDISYFNVTEIKHCLGGEELFAQLSSEVCVASVEEGLGPHL